MKVSRIRYFFYCFDDKVQLIGWSFKWAFTVDFPLNYKLS